MTEANFLESPDTLSSPSISIIVAIYNNAATLQRCIDSVISQTYPYKELVIVDGGSTDGTVEIIKHNNDNIDFWISEPDRGIYHAFNKGIEKTKSDWIYFLGSDDYLWDTKVLDLIAKKLINIPGDDIRLVYGKVALVSPREEVLEIRNQNWNTIKHDFYIKTGLINHQGVLHHRNLFKINGMFDESFSIAADYDLMIRVLQESNPVFLEDLIIAGRQIGGISSRPLSRFVSLKEDHKARRKNDVFKNYNFQWLMIYYIKNLYWEYCKTTITWVLMMINPRLTMYIADIYRIMTGRAPTWIKSHL